MTTLGASDAMAWVQILERDRMVLTCALGAGPTRVGRADDADIALPSERVSRTHCVLERRDDAWWVVDRSRHGTKVGGRPVDEAPLRPGDTFEVGEYRLRLVEDAPVASDATVTRLVRPADHEELLDLGEGCATRRVELVVVDGPAKGAVFGADRARTRLGGKGAHVVLEAALPADAAVVRVVRGRPMLEPGSRPVFLAGQRVRDVTPVLEGECFRVGQHELTVRAKVARDPDDGRLPGFGDLVGSSSAMQALFRVLDRVARHDATVLVHGESGTGKELVARALHDAGTRHDRSFVAINCAAIPEHLVESELFGHEAGAFTGAGARRDGAFQRADGGTLFLDEIGEMSPDVQAKLLRALESGEVRRVGGAKPEFPDVRVVAATHRNLVRKVEEGTFRRDLFYRLAVLTVAIPPLRAHREDVGELARALLAKLHPGAVITSAAVRALEAHDWPGNVRELRNVLTRAVVLHGPKVDVDTLSFHAWAFGTTDEPGASPDDVERARIVDALRQAGNNRAEAARLLGLARTSLLYKLRKHGLEAG